MQKLLIFVFLAIASGVYSDDGPVAGGEVEQNADEYTETAWKAIAAINAGNEAGLFSVPIKVTKAKSQVVAGTLTTLEVLVGESTCAFSAEADISQVNADNCLIKEGGARALFEVQIWEKPWKKFVRITAKKLRDVLEGEEL